MDAHRASCLAFCPGGKGSHLQADWILRLRDMRRMQLQQQQQQQLQQQQQTFAQPAAPPPGRKRAAPKRRLEEAPEWDERQVARMVGALKLLRAQPVRAYALGS